MQGPPTAICSACKQPIIFDGQIRNPKGICIRLNPDYSFHVCHASKLSVRETEELYIAQLQSVIGKLRLQYHASKLLTVTDKDSKELIVNVDKERAALMARFYH